MKKVLSAVFFLTAMMFMIAGLSVSTRTVKTSLLQKYLEHILNEGEETENARAGFPDKAMQWWIEQRQYPNGSIPEHWREEALQHIEKYNRPLSGGKALTWTALGPVNIGGRVRSIVIHPTQTNIIYAGAVSGGVWKTTNSGLNWISLKDNMENLAVCALVMDPSNPQIMYAGTGEGFYNADAIRGAGIFKTTDAGATWTQLAATTGASATNFYFVNKLMIDKNSGTLWAATRKGLFKSTNGGTSFITVLSGSGDVNCADVELAYTNPVTLYASFGLFNDAQIYRSTDAGTNWTSIYTKSGMGRTELATSISNPLVVYASALKLADYQCGNFIKTTDGGATWTAITIPGPSYSGAATYTSSQAWYNNILAVSPADANTLYAGGLDLWKTTNGGTSWTQISNWYTYAGAPPFVHADEHAIVFDPANSSMIYVGNDGGVYRSTTSGATWSSLNNGLAITQFYYGAVHPNNSVYYGGTQDNGNLKSTGATNWSEIISGDGGAIEVDYQTPNTIYAEYVNFAFFKSIDAGVSFTKAMNGIPVGAGYWDGTTDRTQFITPFVIDPNNSSNLIGGTYRVWKTTNKAVSWTAISGDLTGDGTGSSGASITALAVAKGNSSVIYVGCSNGKIQVTTDNGSTWALRNSGLPGLYCTRIAASTGDPAVAFATYSGYASGSKIFKTTNYGSTWTNISSNLPNLPANCIIVDPGNVNNILVGTDLGVFSTTNGGGAWTQESGGMPNVAVSDLDLRSSDNKVFAFTHGRGSFSASFGSAPTNILSLAYDDGTPDIGYYFSGSGQMSANRMTAPTGSYSLMSMSIYLTNVRTGTATFTPIAMRSSSGAPGLQYAVFSSVTASTIPGWNDIDVSAKDIQVSGDFFIGMKYDGTNQPVFGADTIDNGRSWNNNNDGNGWWSWTRTYFMRATVRNNSTDVMIDTRIPSSFTVSENYPNPFNPSTTVRYGLPAGENVTIEIYDVNGRLINRLSDGYQQAGTYSMTWNGMNQRNESVASGAYIFRIKAGNYIVCKKILLMK